MKQTNQSQIRRAVESKLVKMLNGKQESTKEDLQTLGLSIKYLAVVAKLDETEFGSDLEELNEGGDHESEIDS